MTDTGVSGRLPAQPSTPDLNLWLVSRLKGEGSELTFGQIASIAKDLSAALRSPGGDGGLVAALRDMPCIRPCNGRPDDFTVGQCCDAGECGCGNAAALSAAEATSAPTPAPVGGEREELAKWCDDRKANCRAHGDVFGFDTYEKIATALRTPHGLPGEEELVLLMRQNLSVAVSNYGLSADIDGIEDAARAILSRLSPAEDV